MTREDLLRACFGSAEFPPGDDVLELRLGEDVLSHVDVYWRSIQVAGVNLPVAAIAQVSTDPAFRGLGLASSLVRAAHRLAVGRGVEWGALFGAEPLYGRIGYRRPDAAPDEHFLVCPLVPGAVWPRGPIETSGTW